MSGSGPFLGLFSLSLSLSPCDVCKNLEFVSVNAVTSFKKSIPDVGVEVDAVGRARDFGAAVLDGEVKDDFVRVGAEVKIGVGVGTGRDTTGKVDKGTGVIAGGERGATATGAGTAGENEGRGTGEGICLEGIEDATPVEAAAGVCTRETDVDVEIADSIR